MSVILWKIIIALIFLLMFAIGAFLGWRVLALMKRVKQIQDDRNKALEKMGDALDDVVKLSNALRLKGIEVDKLNKERPEFLELERKMMLAALNMPEYGKAIKDPKTSFQVRKVYRNLREKVKESLND